MVRHHLGLEIISSLRAFCHPICLYAALPRTLISFYLSPTDSKGTARWCYFKPKSKSI